MATEGAGPQRVAVSVLVAIRDEERHIEAALAGMRTQDFDGTVEFLLLDGGSVDATLTTLSHLTEGDPRFRVLVRPGWSIPRRLNLGLTSARGDVIARMDAHSVFPANYLSDGVQRLAAGGVASVSGPQIATGEGFWSRRIALALRSPLGRGGARFRRLHAAEIEVDSGFCGLWLRPLLLTHHGWDERAVKGEDMELAFRIRRAGGRIVCVPSMAARYSPRDTLGGLAVQYWRYAERRAWAASLHPRILRRSHLFPPALVLTALAAALAPPRIGRRARRGVGLYGAVVAFESLRLGRGHSLSTPAALPAIFVTMHVAWGCGFITGCVTHNRPRGQAGSAQGYAPRPASTVFSVSQMIKASRRRVRRLT